VSNDSHDDAGGHHVTSGVTLTGLGVFALLTSILIELLGVELLFIEPRTMGVFSSVFIVVGASMIWHGTRRIAVNSRRIRSPAYELFRVKRHPLTELRS
jgi:hypothetical protein